MKKWLVLQLYTSAERQRDGGGGHWLVWMEWRPAGLSVCLPPWIFPCSIKSRSSLLAPVHPGGPGKRAVKWLCVCMCVCWETETMFWIQLNVWHAKRTGHSSISVYCGTSLISHSSIRPLEFLATGHSVIALITYFPSSSRHFFSINPSPTLYYDIFVLTVHAFVDSVIVPLFEPR